MRSRIRPVNKTHPFFLNAPAFRALKRNSDPVIVIQDSSVQKSNTIVNWVHSNDNNTLGGGQKPRKERFSESF